jgi:type IV secretory pathway TraG/TraD family ATPase VirD4
MKNLLYHGRVLYCRISAALATRTSLHTARFAYLHELSRMTVSKAAIATKLPAIFLASGKYDRVFCVKPTKTQQELGNVALIGKTRIGKGLTIETNLLTWPSSTIANDIKGGELFYRTGGFRETLGKVFVFDPRGRGCRFDPLEGKTTDSDVRSAATTLLYRPQEKENVSFTERAITMLVAIFTAAILEGERLLPFTYTMINEGLIGAATRLEIISRKHNYYPNLAMKFLDIEFPRADFTSRFLQDCWSTLTARMNQILTKESIRCFTGSDFTAEDIITGKIPLSVYLCWPEEDLEYLAPLIQLVWDSLIKGMLAAYSKARGQGCVRVLAILDEIFRTGLPKLPEYATTVCGRNISLLIGAQSRSQMDSYGVFNGHILRGQIDSIVYYRPAPDDYETQAHIEKVLGYTSGFARSKNEHEDGTSRGENEQRIPLMPAHETELLAATTCILKRSGIRASIEDRLDWHEFPELVRRAAIDAPEEPLLPAFDGKPPNGFHAPTPRFPIPLFRERQ